MKKPVVIIGMGEMGGVFARGFLRSGHPVFPVVRDSNAVELAKQIPDPELVLVAVAETDLHAVLETIPENWRDRLVMLQNELLPVDWQQHNLNNPTIISVWFEKKKGKDAKVIIPSPVYGPGASLIQVALGSIDIPVDVLQSANHLLFELVVKNVYILTTNIAGLETGGTVGELWSQHRDTATQVAHEVIKIQQALTGQAFDSEKLIAAMVQAFEGDPDHKCMGRSAPARLKRALDLAEQHNINVPKMRAISAKAN